MEKHFGRLLRLNAICPYYTMFPIDFPLKHLGRMADGGKVLDPFCGRGTTVFAARLLGLPVAGIDSSPLAVAISKAKLVDVSSDDVVRRAEQILALAGEPKELPEGEFWMMAFHPETLRDICRLRETLIEGHGDEVETALRAITLGILHGPLMKGLPSYLSNQMPRTYATKPQPAVRFWKSHGLRPPRVEVLEVIRRRAKYVFDTLPRKVFGLVVQGDSRRFATVWRVGEDFNLVVTSPPYFGMRSYRADQWLREWFLGGPSEVRYDYDGQLGRGSQEEYVTGLARVWRNVANVCVGGAKLVVRFGALPSVKGDPCAMIMDSLVVADVGWKVENISRAGYAKRGRRQAEQFLGNVGKAVEEIDVEAVLNA